jgi:hypothetical protein
LLVTQRMSSDPARLSASRPVSTDEGVQWRGSSSQPLGGGPRAAAATSVDSRATTGCWPWQRLCCGYGSGGDHMDVTDEESDTVNADEVVEHVVSTLAQDSGVLRARHGDRLILLYGRGVAAVEVAPRGAVV